MVYLFKEDMDLVGFEVVLPNRPGALEFALSLVKKHDLNIIHIENCTFNKKICRFFMAIDFTDKEVSPEDLLRDFKESKDYIVDAVISPNLKDVIFPSKFCVKDLGGMRAILLGLGNMKGIILGIKKEFGVESGNSFLYHLGYDVGEETYEVYAVPREMKSFSDGIMLLKALVRGAGWADIIEYEETDDKIIISFEDLWECEIQKGLVDKPASHYIRGFLAGFFSNLLEKKVIVNETKCIAVEDPYCQFEINIIT